MTLNTPYHPCISADAHERVYKAYWRGLYASVADVMRATGHDRETCNRLIEVPTFNLLHGVKGFKAYLRSIQ